MSARTLALVFALATIAYPAAQAADDAAAKPAEAPATASMPMDCATMMSRHDHGAAEKGTPTPSIAAKCPMASATETGDTARATMTPKAKAKRGHDHARTHKLM